MHTIITHPDTWPFMLIAIAGILFSFTGVIVLAIQYSKLRNQFIDFLTRC
tara:strand:+ start:357 stop:506 length:150 start_codon:yes stop_codon:yes gene_type:complete